MPKERSRVSDINIDFNNQSPKDSADLGKAEKDFAKFYREHSSEDLSVLMKNARRRRTWLYITSVLALLLGLALTGFFVFNRSNGKFGEESVKVYLQGPESAPSGQELEYTLNYENNQNVPLNNLSVTLRYPEGFTFVSSIPTAQNAEGTRFALGKVNANDKGTLVIKGQLVGEVEEKKEFSGFVSYEPENFKAQFSRTFNLETKVVASVANLDVQGPTQLPVDQDLVLNVAYRNSSASKVSNLLLRLNSPSGFVLEVPKLDTLPDTANTWKIGNLEPKSEGKIELRGKFTDTAQPGNQEFKLALGILASNGHDFTMQEEKTFSLTLIKSHLTLQLTANDVSLKSAVDLGQEIVYEASFVNEGEVPFSELTLKAKLAPQFFDWSTLKDEALGTVDAASGTIIWTKANLPMLGKLDPGMRGSVRFRISTQTTAPAGLSAPFQFTSSVEAQGQQLLNGNLQDIVTQSNEVVTKVNTKFSLAAEGRYYTDELVKLGSGPLPPRVEETTTYVIFWKLSNTLNEIENVEVTTTLPQGVTWTGQSAVSAGQKVTYNPNTREVSWQLNRLPAGAGVLYTKPEASFEVAITPEASDADKILVLTKTTTATAHDTFSGADLIATSKFITTELDDDLGAQGKGVVVR